MTEFEIIILIALYLFAFSYMANSYGMADKRTWKDVLLIIVVAATFGIISFPMTLAGDIWYKLNKEE